MLWDQLNALTLPEAHALLRLGGICSVMDQVLDMGMADGHLADLGVIQGHDVGTGADSSLLLVGSHGDWGLGRPCDRLQERLRLCSVDRRREVVVV